MTEVTIRIDSVRVEGRYRRQLGDIDALAKSIADIGLINAIAVTPDGRLVAGQRRLEACRRLGWDTIPARQIESLTDAIARLKMERDENTQRLEMAVSERVALAAALEELEKPRAAQRQYEARVRAGKIRQGKPTPPASCSQEQDAGSARDIAAQAVDMAPTTYYKARKVVEAAQDPTAPPEQRQVARAALADMDATGNVTGNYEKVRGTRDMSVGSPKRTVMGSAAAQRKAISAAVTTLSGITHGLAQIAEVHPDITSEEAAQWVGGLSESRRVIESLIKRLRERNNAQA